ncbi:unnamed protein product [Prorocentrum cordatum]|uniref:Pentatricopeptide repeat-containing protein n=1 Tax=Prorocentrum cordatum TaxID=2364126 RepID=A0ABN9WPN1_9DINO|nr:unnamed protein product [Polarella glacialis]
MEEAGFVASQQAYEAIVKAFLVQGNLGQASAWLAKAVQGGSPCGQELVREVLAGHVAAGDAAATVRVVDDLERRSQRLSALTYNVALRGLVRGAAGGAAGERWLDRMAERGVKPDADTHALLVLGSLREGNVTRAERWYDSVSGAGPWRGGSSRADLRAACARSESDWLDLWDRGVANGMREA